MRRWIKRLMRKGFEGEINHPVNESLRNKKVDRLFQRGLSGQLPSPYFFI